MSIVIDSEMRAGLSPTDIWKLPRPEQLALINGISDRVGLHAIFGPDEAERAFHEREQLMREHIEALYPHGLPGGDGPRLIRIPGGFSPIWEIGGRKIRFVGQIARAGEGQGLRIYEEPIDDVDYVQVTIDPSLESGDIGGWLPGSDFRKFRASDRT